MKDIMGKPIAVGDQVVIGLGGSMTLRRGEVIKINPKTVDVKLNSREGINWKQSGEPRRKPTDVIVVSDCW